MITSGQDFCEWLVQGCSQSQGFTGVIEATTTQVSVVKAGGNLYLRKWAQQ